MASLDDPLPVEDTQETGNDWVLPKSLQDSIQEEVGKLNSWKGTLHFGCLEGYGEEKKDLFQFADKSFYKPQQRQASYEHPIRFDRDKYPPTEEGWLDLRKELKSRAIEEGSDLISKRDKFQLICFRCRISKSHDYKRDGYFRQVGLSFSEGALCTAELGPSAAEVGPNASELSEQPTQLEDLDENGETVLIEEGEYDEDGVKLGIREHYFHRERSYNRPDGKGAPRGTSTSRPIDSAHTCKASLQFRIKPNHYIYLVCGVGSSDHRFHSKPIPNSLAKKKRHVIDGEMELSQNAGKAAIGVSSCRQLLLEHTNSYYSHGTMRRMRQLQPDFLQSTGEGNGQSTASRMVNWLRKMAADPEYLIGYCILNHKKDGSEKYHKHPKGRPSKKEPRMPIPDVVENLTYSNTYSVKNSSSETQEYSTLNMDDTGSSCGETGTDEECSTSRHGFMETLSKPMPKEDTAYLTMAETVHVVEAKEDPTTTDIERRRRLLKDYSVDAERVLMGAAWIDADGWQQFCRYPEVIFCDATHKTNNEGRPLLVVVGRDNRGKAFVIMRILMPNESAAFYRWVFLTCFPKLLGEANLKRVRIFLTDGDSVEFNAVDEAIFLFIKNARRLRCGFHLVQKTWEKHIYSGVHDSPVVHRICHMIRAWVYSWMNGSNCYTKEQFGLSRDLLYKFLNTKSYETDLIGEATLIKIRHWLTNSILDKETSFVMHAKTYIRCFDEYVNNSAEAMNLAQKKSNMSAKPNMNMHESANAMLKHAFLKNRDRKSSLTRTLYGTPLYLSRNGVHPIDVHRQLVTIAQHLIIFQYKRRKQYTKMQLSTDTWLVMHNKVAEKAGEDSPNSKTNRYFKLIPKFLVAHKVCLCSGVLVCGCGYKQRYGIPCRHLFALESVYDINDIDVRWQSQYALHAFTPGCSDLTQIFLRREEVELKGIRLKNLVPFSAETSLPCLLPGAERTKEEIMDVYNSPYPLCWNYQPNDYPVKYRQMEVETDDDDCDDFGTFCDDSSENHQFTQESIGVGVSDALEDHLFNREVSQAELVGKFKSMVGLFTTPASRRELFETLQSCEDKRERALIQQRGQQLVTDADTEYTSSHLPHSTDKRSTQSTYLFRRKGKRKRPS